MALVYLLKEHQHTQHPIGNWNLAHAQSAIHMLKAPWFSPH